ncbi:hypothetical protein M3202_15015 [Alkalihalobacillus oceani]|uniref:Uncharacterized protein n=1 Tax=Halalkalibacter oceani TaxID=1653776 RepID=A0A9X2DRJ5_9BACI|nr:hypothetical protein [Halalkalibacter oceani]MCM3715381.1 hypothetical protein [Halalkalibacter oceani]
MRIFLYELKKLFTWKIMLLLFIVASLFYQLFISFYFDHFPNGRPNGDSHLVLIEMREDYGRFFDEEEFVHFQEKYEERVTEADQFLQARPEYVEAGMGTYADFRNRSVEGEYELSSRLLFDEGVDLFWELQAREYMIERYSRIGTLSNDYNEAQQSREQQLIDSGQITAIFSGEIFSNYNSLITYTTVLILLSLMVLLTPVYLRDRRTRLVELQYTFKKGRPLLITKLFASLTASFLLITVYLAALFLLYRGNNTAMFLDAPINSFFNYEMISWFDLTFSDYIALTIGAVYLLGFLFTLLIFFISSVVPNYISAVGVQVPLAFVSFSIGLDYLLEHLTTFWLPVYMQPLLYGCLITGAIILIVVRWRRERQADVLY